MTRIATWGIALATLIFLVGLSFWIWSLATTGGLFGLIAAILLAFFAVLGFWTLGYEMYFGVKAEKLGKQLEAEGALPEETVSVTPSGRLDREEATGIFPSYQQAVTAEPESWRAWYRLGLVYDAAGDRAQARKSIRKAIQLERVRS